MIETPTPPTDDPELELKASDVLAGALDYWGEGGKNWASGIWFGTHTACLYGGMLKAAYGPDYRYAHRPSTAATKQTQTIYSEGDWRKVDPAKERAYKRAEKFLLDELEARGHLGEGAANAIIRFNDRLASKLARKKNPDAPIGRLSKAARFAEVKDVVCHALKRAMAAGE